MGVSILSYAGKVQFGLITDVALTPNPDAVVRHFPEEFEKYLYYVLLDAQPSENEPADEAPEAPAPAAAPPKARRARTPPARRAKTKSAAR